MKGTDMKVYLWHKRFGFVTMSSSPNNQWVGDKGVRYGAFHADYMAMAVNLPLDEVVLTYVW
jgi:hypothetical protein